MRTNHNKIIIGILLALVAITLLSVIPVDALTVSCPMCGKDHEMGDVKGWQFVYDWCSMVYGGSSITSMGLSGVLGMDVTSGAFGSVWSKVEAVYNALMIIGQILVVIFFSMEMLDIYAEDKLTPESFTRTLMKLVISLLIINNGFKIMEVFVGMANIIFTRLQNGVASSIATNNCNFARLAQENLFGRLGEMFKLVVPYAFIAAALMVLQFFCYLRLLDVIVKTLFAPIGMADLGFKGTNGTGWRYLKKLLASALQGAVMLAILYVQSILSQSANWIEMLILYIAMIAAFRKAQSLANDVVGL